MSKICDTELNELEDCDIELQKELEVYAELTANTVKCQLQKRDLILMIVIIIGILYSNFIVYRLGTIDNEIVNIEKKITLCNDANNIKRK